MNKRIQFIRKTLGISGENFGERIGVTRSAISNIENGNRSVTDQMIKIVCREFNVNEEWLRYGTGEMFLPKPRDIIHKLAKQYNLSEEHIVMVEQFIGLPEESRNTILNYMKQVVMAIEENKNMTEEEMENILKMIPDDPRELDMDIPYKKEA